jgi:hypothetical protein
MVQIAAAGVVVEDAADQDVVVVVVAAVVVAVPVSRWGQLREHQQEGETNSTMSQHDL